MRVLQPVDDAPAAVAAPGKGGLATRARKPGAGPGPWVAACSALAGAPILNRDDEELGTLEDIMIDAADGRVAYGVLSRGGVLGLGARLYAVPWKALAFDRERSCFMLDVSVERLRQAPGFDREHWPSMADARFARAAEEFYRQRAPDEMHSLR